MLASFHRQRHRAPTQNQRMKIWTMQPPTSAMDPVLILISIPYSLLSQSARNPTSQWPKQKTQASEKGKSMHSFRWSRVKSYNRVNKKQWKVGKFCCKPHTHTHTLTHAHTCTLTHTLTHAHTYAHTWRHTDTYTHSHMHTHIHMKTHIHTLVHLCTYLCTHVHTYVHTWRHTYTHMHAHIYTHAHTYTHMHTLTHVHTHAHTCTQTFQEILNISIWFFFNIYESNKNWVQFCSPQRYTTESMITSETLESLWLSNKSVSSGKWIGNNMVSHNHQSPYNIHVHTQTCTHMEVSPCRSLLKGEYTEAMLWSPWKEMRQATYGGGSGQSHIP